MSNTDTTKLTKLGLPHIQSLDDLSAAIGVSKYTLYQLSHHSDKYYKTYEVAKKSGGKRTISQPARKLKGLQSWILFTILNKMQVSPSCMGFRKGSSTLDNATPHVGAGTILNMDLQNFFPTVTAKQVFSIFRRIGFNDLISNVFTNICTCDGRLPQGSPCSPYLANLATWTLDLRIQGYVGKRGISYTRYADDLSFSGPNPSTVVKIIPMVKEIIEDENFVVNHKKTRVAGAARAKTVTGLVVNEESVGIGKKKYKDLRAKIHHLTLPEEQKNEKLLYHVSGWLSYLNSVDKARFEKAKKYIKGLSKKYPKTLVGRLGV